MPNTPVTWRNQVTVNTTTAGLQADPNIIQLDNGNIPTTEQGLKALVERPASGPAAPNWKAGGYLPKVPVDPWGGPYKYTTPSTQGGEFEIISFGADGVPGGEGKNADIVSWDLDRN